MAAPPEILCTIFDNLDNLSTAMKVCSDWRAAVIGNPVYWTKPDVVTGDVLLPERARWVQDTLRRSKEQNLDLRIRLEREDTAFAVAAANLFALILPHLCRCTTLSIIASRAVWLAIFDTVLFPSTATSFPRLQTLRLCNSSLYQSALYHDEQQLVFPFPMDRTNVLEELTLAGVTLPMVPLPNLECVDIECHLPDLVAESRIPGCDWQCLRPVFFTEPKELRLFGLSIPFIREDLLLPDPDPSPLEHLELTDLRVLPLYDDTPGRPSNINPIAGFFTALNTSSITSLILSDWSPATPIFHHLVHYLQLEQRRGTPKFPSVTELTLHNMPLLTIPALGSARFFYAFFTAFPKLETLTLDNTTTFEELTTMMGGHPELCPELVTFHIEMEIHDESEGMLPV